MTLFVIALLVIGPQRLPQVARTLGRGLAEVKKYRTMLTSEVNELLDEPKSALGGALGEVRQVRDMAMGEVRGAADSALGEVRQVADMAIDEVRSGAAGASEEVASARDAALEELRAAAEGAPPASPQLRHRGAFPDGPVPWTGAPDDPSLN